MNKLKKVAAAVVALACSFALATTAFAATAAQRDKLAAALAGYGVSNASDIVATLSDAQVDNIVANKAALKGVADKAQADVAENPMNAKAILEAAASQAGVAINVTSAGVDRDRGTVVVTAQVNGVDTVATPKVNHPGAASDDKSGTTSSTTTSAAPQNTAVAAAVASSSVSPAALTGSSTAVIKATGDSSFAVVLASVLAVAAVLGMAVRKNTQMNVA